MAQARCGRVDRRRRQVSRLSGGLRRRRPVPERTTSPGIVEGGLREGKDSAHPAPPERLRPQLLLYLDLHERSSRLARRAPEGMKRLSLLRHAGIGRKQAIVDDVARGPRPGLIGIAAHVGVRYRYELARMRVAQIDVDAEDEV